MTDDNGWSEWQNYVLAELKRLSRSVDRLADQVLEHRDKTTAEISALKVKAGIWGGLGGLIPGIIIILWYLAQKLMN